MLATQTVDKVPLKDLDDCQIAECTHLTLDNGRMLPDFERLLHYKSPQVKNIAMKRQLETATAYLIYDDEKLAAWALIKGQDSPKAYFFVAPAKRRQGFGKLLAETVYEDYPKIEFVGWNKESISFFMSLDIPLTFHASIYAE